MQLRPRARVVLEEPECRPAHKKLRGKDVRPGGDDDAYSCSICLVSLQMRDGHANWSQCPHCKHVFHCGCIDAHVRASPSDDEFACPMCKAKCAVDSLDEWYAVDLMETVRDDDSTYEEEEEGVDRSDRTLRPRK